MCNNSGCHPKLMKQRHILKPPEPATAGARARRLLRRRKRPQGTSTGNGGNMCARHPDERVVLCSTDDGELVCWRCYHFSLYRGRRCIPIDDFKPVCQSTLRSNHTALGNRAVQLRKAKTAVDQELGELIMVSFFHSRFLDSLFSSCIVVFLSLDPGSY